MARVTIAGYYGYGNAGDEAMLEAMLTGLRGLRPDAPITVLSGSPEATAGLHRVQAVNARSPGAVAKALLKSELVISGGGSLLQDDTSAQNLIYHLGILAFARWGGAKTMVYAQGVGPLRRAVSRLAVRRVLNRVDIIAVRDGESASLLAEVGVAGAVHVTADPVLALQAPGALPPRTAFPEAGGRPVCLICPRAFPGWPQTKPVLAAAASHLAGTFAAHIALLPLQPERDGAACRELREAMGGGASLVTPPARIGPLLSLIGAAELVVGVRLHALIFATVMGVGCLGIGYDPKVGNFLAELGQAPLPAGAKGEDVMVGLERAWAERAALARRARELLPGLRARAGRTAELAASLLGGPGSGQD